MDTDVDFETETVLDYFPLIAALLESPRLRSGNSASPRTVTTHQPAIQLPIHPLAFKGNREEAPRVALCIW